MLVYRYFTKTIGSNHPTGHSGNLDLVTFQVRPPNQAEGVKKHISKITEVIKLSHTNPSLYSRSRFPL